MFSVKCLTSYECLASSHTQSVEDSNNSMKYFSHKCFFCIFYRISCSYLFYFQPVLEMIVINECPKKLLCFILSSYVMHHKCKRYEIEIMKGLIFVKVWDSDINQWILILTLWDKMRNECHLLAQDQWF